MAKGAPDSGLVVLRLLPSPLLQRCSSRSRCSSQPCLLYICICFFSLLQLTCSLGVKLSAALTAVQAGPTFYCLQYITPVQSHTSVHVGMSCYDYRTLAAAWPNCLSLSLSAQSSHISQACCCCYHCHHHTAVTVITMFWAHHACIMLCQLTVLHLSWAAVSVQTCCSCYSVCCQLVVGCSVTVTAT